MSFNFFIIIAFLFIFPDYLTSAKILIISQLRGLLINTKLIILIPTHMIRMINKTWLTHVLGYMSPSLTISLIIISITVYKIGMREDCSFKLTIFLHGVHI